MDEDGDFGVEDEAHQGQAGASLYRMDSNLSSASIFEDVEMAHDEVCLLVNYLEYPSAVN